MNWKLPPLTHRRRRGDMIYAYKGGGGGTILKCTKNTQWMCGVTMRDRGIEGIDIPVKNFELG